MAKTVKPKAPKAKKEVVETTEIVKEVSSIIEKVVEVKIEPEIEDVYAEVQKLINAPTVFDIYLEANKQIGVPTIEKYLTTDEPDAIDEFDVFVKAKVVAADKAWVKDLTLLKKVEGREFTLSGTKYFGELKS